jgi:hypothetical protein
MNLIFLDIDGVLNGHQRQPGSPYCGIQQENVKPFNWLLERLEPQIVLSSAWRYIVHGKDMTLSGFEYMLLTHGVFPIVNRIVGTTIPDETCVHCGFKHRKRHKRIITKDGLLACHECRKTSTRGEQVSRYRFAHACVGRPYVVIDDIDIGISAERHPFVKTHPGRGLTMAKAREVVKLMEGQT